MSVLVVAGCGAGPTAGGSISAPVSEPAPSASPPAPAPRSSAASAPEVADPPIVVLDPGHNGANAANPDLTTRQVPDGRGGVKDCNTTGTATDAGYPEHAFNWDVAGRVSERLSAAGVQVVLTRDDDEGVGPCIDERGQAGEQADADAVVSIHADGSDPGDSGFHVALSDPAVNPVQEGPSRELATEMRDAMSEADALIFLMPHARGVDADVLAAFQRLFRGAGLSAVNAVGVLSKVDRLVGAGQDPWPPALRVARRVAGELRGVVCSVLPVLGLLAECSRTGRLTEADVRALRQLTALDPIELSDVLLSATEFLELPDLGSSRDDRARLLEMLDLHGLRICLDALRAAPVSAGALGRRLAELSGVEALERQVAEVFTQRADLLKAHAGICDLIRISHGTATPGDAGRLRALRDPLERLALDDRMHDLRVLDVLRCAGDGTLALPDELARDLERLALGSTPATRLGLWPSATSRQVAEAAAVRAGRWGAFGNDLRRSPAEARLARDVKTAFELVHTSATTPRAW